MQVSSVIRLFACLYYRLKYIIHKMTDAFVMKLMTRKWDLFASYPSSNDSGKLVAGRVIAL